MRNRRRSIGATLVELVVASALVLLIMGELWMLLQTGTRFYLRSRSQSDVQRHALIALRWMSTDLAEGAPLSFKHYDPDNPSIVTDRNGFVFGSPKGMDEEASYNDEGRLLWTSVIGYYIDPETKDLIRAKMLLEEPKESAPQILDELYHVTLMEGAPNKRMVAKEAYDIVTVQGPQDIQVTLRFRDEDLGYGLTIQTRLEMKNK
ncbi:MAG: hypothetical protein KC800_21535 [Candidatus Eremiobacteraeota bacterium]|nr:hypothetical protein [Candidatus Eremiobacteraeota bacterium]